MRVEFRPDGTVKNIHPDTETQFAWLPDDTKIRTETPQGRETPHGPLRVAKAQAADWPARAARVWDDGANQWIDTGNPPVQSSFDRALAKIQTAIPSNPSVVELRDHVAAQQRVILQILEVVDLYA